MRDIKFRALDKEKKVFVKGMLCFGYDDFEWVLLNDNYEQILWNYNGELQQYTGLKDKNGVEIYEGDIGKNERGTLFKVVYSEKNASYELVTINENRFHYKVHWIDNLEVIGNIYENKELLEGF